jgi:hypothetical protein
LHFCKSRNASEAKDLCILHPKYNFFHACKEKAPEFNPGAIYHNYNRLNLAMVPVAIVMPAMFVTVPPSVVPAPATLAFRIQVSPPLVSLVAALAVFANRLIELDFPALDFMLALCMVVGIRCGHGNQHRGTQSRGHNC